jgi:ABC-type branched-subunit amino acid transport system substrate-binding protein
VSEAIRGLDIQTALGSVQFTPEGDLRSPKIYIFQVKEGQFAQIAP